MTRLSGKLILQYAFCIVCAVFIFDVILNYKSVDISFKRANSARSALEQWTQCMNREIKPDGNDVHKIWHEDWMAAAKCQNETLLKGLDIVILENKRSQRYHILPKDNSESVIVTLGNSSDLSLPIQLQQKLGKNSVFFGADAGIDVNKPDLAQLGMFFPFAVGPINVMDPDNDVPNKPKTVTVDLTYFLDGIVEKHFYDAVWMNYPDHNIIRSLFKNSEMDKKGIVICQINIELDFPRTDGLLLLLHEHITQLIQDERYAILRTEQGNIVRMYLLNMVDNTCTHRYFSSK